MVSNAARHLREPGRANPTVRQDPGYGATSALALVVEAVEALALLSDCDPGLTAAVRPFERSAL